MPWRNHIPVHPAADIFPLLRETAPDDLAKLAADIKEHGLRVPLAVFVEYGEATLLDGRNRLDAIEMAGLDVEKYWQAAEIYQAGEHKADDLVIGLNVHRRHLGTAEKQRVLAELLKRDPERSNSELARLVRVDQKTAGAARRREEKRGTIPRATHTRGRDGRVRTTTPAPRPPRAPPSLVRDQAVVNLSAVLREPGQGLADIIRVIRDYNDEVPGACGRIAKMIGAGRREQLVIDFARAISLPWETIEQLRAENRQLVAMVDQLRARLAATESRSAPQPLAEPAAPETPLGERVRAKMRELGLSQDKLAARWGIPQPTISRVMRGENLRAKTAAALREALEREALGAASN